jgi:acyl carrier protein phosphodiesterase
MNFFGHAWVAGWFSGQAPFVLGAMLPDLASALREAPPSAHDTELVAGIRLHHATDSAFHGTQAFRALDERGRKVLAALGLAKGPRRALAHIGVEFLIDEHLARQAPPWSLYSDALQFGATERCRLALRWGSANTNERFAGLCRALAASAGSLSDQRRLVPRLVAALSGRPRLELLPKDVPLLQPWLAECRAQVELAMPQLLAELAHGLGTDVIAPNVTSS